MATTGGRNFHMSRVDTALGALDEREAVVEGRAASMSAFTAGALHLSDEIRAAARAACVLIQGESSEAVLEIARRIHAMSERTGPFVYVDCASAEPSAIEREVFGSAPAGTADLEIVDARSAVPGARGAPLFLANLADLSAAAQARLARIARDGELHVSGEGSRRLDARLLASLTAASHSQALRADLLRHVGRVKVALPASRHLATLKA